MNCLNFDQDFSEYAQKWIKENRAKYKNADELEAQIPDVYIRWMNTPAAFLGGIAPAMYYQQYDSAKTLVHWMRDYYKQNVPVPELLLQRIHELGEDAVPELMLILTKPGRFEQEAAMTAISLLSELESETPMPVYIEWILAAQESSELLDSAVEALSHMGPDVAERLLERAEEASDIALGYMADVLYNKPHDDRILQILLRRFETGDKALLASYLGRYGDERALRVLKPALTEPGLNYLEYIEIRNAIEALGDEVNELAPEFDGDPYYETMKQMDGLNLPKEDETDETEEEELAETLEDDSVLSPSTEEPTMPEGEE